MTQGFLFERFREPLAETAPSSRPGTSQEAAEHLDATGVAGKLRQAVYDALRASSDGLTDEELQSLLGLPGNTERPRRRELEQAGRIVDSGKRRKTSTGRAAIVWEARR